MNKVYYKAADVQGWDFYTHKTINYAENIGKTVKVSNYKAPPVLCSDSVIHASPKPLGVFVGANIPCRIFLVKGKPLVKDKEKCGFKELTVLEELPQEKLDDLFGFKYSEAVNPIHPFKIATKPISDEQIGLLQNWDSIGDSIGASIRASIRASIWDSIWYSIGASIWDSIGAYIGSLFPNVKTWKYIKHKKGEYPFQPAVDLWKQGFVPSFDKKTWRLHAGLKGLIVFEIGREALTKWAPSTFTSKTTTDMK